MDGDIRYGDAGGRTGHRRRDRSGMEGDIRVEWVYTGGPAKIGIIRYKHVPGVI